jgi:hypothetical protein
VRELKTIGKVASSCFGRGGGGTKHLGFTDGVPRALKLTPRKTIKTHTIDNIAEEYVFNSTPAAV